jgi:hypothetical protein
VPPFIEQLQGNVSDTSRISMNFLDLPSTFNYNQGMVDSGTAQMGGQGLDPFVGIEENHGDGTQMEGYHGEGMGMGMDMDDPVLNSLQTMAEARDFADMDQPQNFDVWEWFEMQQQ